MKKFGKAFFIITYVLLWVEVYTHNENINDMLNREFYSA